MPVSKKYTYAHTDLIEFFHHINRCIRCTRNIFTALLRLTSQYYRHPKLSPCDGPSNAADYISIKETCMSFRHVTVLTLLPVRQFVWLLTVATYGLVIANSKWQIYSDQTFFDLGLRNTIFVPQLFYAEKQQQLELFVVKVSDDILVAGNDEVKRMFIDKRAKKYELGTITHLPGTCLFFGLQLLQEINYTIRINADHKLRKIEPYPLSRQRRL